MNDLDSIMQEITSENLGINLQYAISASHAMRDNPESMVLRSPSLQSELISPYNAELMAESAGSQLRCLTPETGDSA